MASVRELGWGWVQRLYVLPSSSLPRNSLACIWAFIFFRFHSHGRIPLSTPSLAARFFRFQLLSAPRMYKVPLKSLRKFSGLSTLLRWERGDEIKDWRSWELTTEAHALEGNGTSYGNNYSFAKIMLRALSPRNYHFHPDTFVS